MSLLLNLPSILLSQVYSSCRLSGGWGKELQELVTRSRLIWSRRSLTKILALQHWILMRLSHCLRQKGHYTLVHSKHTGCMYDPYGRELANHTIFRQSRRGHDMSIHIKCNLWWYVLSYKNGQDCTHHRCP